MERSLVGADYSNRHHRLQKGSRQGRVSKARRCRGSYGDLGVVAGGFVVLPAPELAGVPEAVVFFLWVTGFFGDSELSTTTFFAGGGGTAACCKTRT